MENENRKDGETRARFEADSGVYSPKSICRAVDSSDGDYFSRLLWIKLDLVRKHGTGQTVLDLGCATGEHLLAIAPQIKMGTGLDFSRIYIEKARQTQRSMGIENVSFTEGNARKIPFENGKFDLVYSFSSLYCMSDVHEVIGEIARVLATGGRCVLDMGNLFSLNTIVARAYPELAAPYHLSLGEMKKLFRESKLQVLEHRAFQILPLWGDRPAWLRPLLAGYWKRSLSRLVGGRTLDERICAVPGLRALAFRHIFVCQKAGN